MATAQGSQPAPEPGWMRASDADRERVIDLLKTAFTDGRLTTGELGERVAAALTARTHADLATLTADIPPAASPAPPPAAAPPPETGPAPAPPTARRRVGPPAKAGIALVVSLIGMLVDAALTGANAGPMANGFYVIFIGIFLVAFVTWLWTLSADHGDCPAGPPPRRPVSGAPGDQARPAQPIAPPPRKEAKDQHFSERRVAFP